MTDHEGKEEVVQAAALRDTHREGAGPEKLEAIFRQHHAQVFRAAYRITGSASDAEDVLQTVFLRLLGLERGGTLSETPGSYLHRAAVNASLDLVRNRRTWKSAPIEEIEHLPDDSLRGAERKREDDELKGRVRKALSELSPRMAEIFALRYFEGYDNHEIARMLNASRSTVAVLLHRARRRLKKDMHAFLGESR